MTDLNLVLKFQLAGEEQFHIRGAARIRVDGRGGLMFFDVQSGTTERIEVERLRSFSLHAINAAAPDHGCALVN